MSDSLSYADRARKAISPSNLAVKALSIVAHHSNPQPIDDWPQVGSQRKVDDSKNTSPIVNKSNNLAFIVSKSISSPARLQPQNKSSSSSGSQTPAYDLPANQKVIFGSIDLETPPPLSPQPALVHPEITTKTPTFSVGLDDSNEQVPARLKSRTRPSGRLDTEEPESTGTSHSTTPTSATTTQPPNKWKFGTTTSTPVVNGKKPLPSDDSSGTPSSSSLLFHQSRQPDTDSNRSKGRERAISFGYIDTLLPLDENVSTVTKSKTKSKTKTKTKVNPGTKSSPPVEVTNQIEDVDPIPHPNSIPGSDREDRDADSDLDFKVRDFGFGFGSGGVRYAQVGPGGGDEGHPDGGDSETGDKQNTPSPSQQSPQPGAGSAPIPSSTPPYQHRPPPHSQSLARSSKRGNTFGIPRGGGYGSYNERGVHERGGYASGYERGGRRPRGGMNGYPSPRGHPSGRGYNRDAGPGPASSHSSPGGGGQRVPYDNVTSPLHFSQLPYPNQHVMDPIYYPPPRHGGPPGPFDPYQSYPHPQQSHLPPLPHLQGYPHFQQIPPPLPPHLLASISSSSLSASVSNSGGISTGSPTASGSAGDDMPSTTISTSTSVSTSPPPPNASSTSSTSSTSPRSPTPPSSHILPPVPIPLTILPFALDSIRYYLLGQLEYYLSPQNMAQDFFLRQQMDTKGYIPISLLASFNRIKQLTLDTRLVKEVLLLSAYVEVNGGMVRMGGASSTGGGSEGQNQHRGSWESFVLPDAIESVVEDVENVDGGYGYHQQLNGYGYGGSGYGYGYGTGYAYGYGYGYPPVGPAGLGYYEDPQSQQHQHQRQGDGSYESGGGEGVDEPGHSSSHDHGETSISNGHGGGVGESDNLDDASVSPTSMQLPKGKTEENKPNGILKHGDEEEYEDEDEDEEEDIVFVMGTDVSTSWTPERERRS